MLVEHIHKEYRECVVHRKEHHIPHKLFVGQGFILKCPKFICRKIECNDHNLIENNRNIWSNTKHRAQQCQRPQIQSNTNNTNNEIFHERMSCIDDVACNFLNHVIPKLLEFFEYPQRQLLPL